MKKFSYHYDGKISTYTILYKNKQFTGTAICAPEDSDMNSERTGLFIAEARANIKLLKYIKKEYLFKLKILQDF